MKRKRVIRKIGSLKLEMDKSHLLSFYLKEYGLYDRSLPIIGKLLKDIDGELSVIDIGANIGDTVSLMSEKVKGRFLCIEGDKKFLPYLKKNIKKIVDSEVKIYDGYCSDKDINENTFKIESQNGTSKFIKTSEAVSSKVEFKKLDTILKENSRFLSSNLLKIDTDGFEINILKGSADFLKRARPVIHVEFTPDFYRALGQNPMELIKVLADSGYSSALFIDNFGIPTDITKLSDTKKIEELVSRIDYSNIYYYDILAIHTDNERKYKDLFYDVILEITKLSAIFSNEQKLKKIEIEKKYKIHTEEAKKHVSILEDQILRLKKKNIAERESFKQQLLEKSAELQQINALANNYLSQLNEIQNSKAWRLILKLRKIFNLLIPQKFRHLNLVSRSLESLKKIPIYIEILIRKIKPRKRLKVNNDSNRIVYVGHSYHKKTLSTVFLIEYLKEHFDVTEVWDESWEGKPYPDLGFIDDSYIGVVFFQSIPEKEVLEKIDNKNIIFIPMYDGYENSPYSFWKKYENIKILNFAKALHLKLKKWGFNTIYLQRYPKPFEFNDWGEEESVFFYNRNSLININTVKKLIGENKYKIHLHKTMDPGYEFVKPSKEDEKKYSITYSEWFVEKKDKWAVAQKSAIFIAPRITEGIGQGEIEALAHGRAVVAVNAPTLNEYIIHNVNGYLYDFNNPQPIDFSNLREVQRNAYKSIVDGYNKWEKKKVEIINFIKSS